jgi:hypothetical protein
MKAIINGFRYDTEKAIEVGSYDYGNAGDFEEWSATLYKTPRAGRYFLAGRGGPMTMYRSTSDGRNFGWGSAITPMTEEEAFDWAQEYLSPEEIETHFADMIEDA